MTEEAEELEKGIVQESEDKIEGILNAVNPFRKKVSKTEDAAQTGLEGIEDKIGDVEKVLPSSESKEVAEAEDKAKAILKTEAKDEIEPSASRFLGDMVNNKMNGVLEKYDENKNLTSSSRYQNGVLHGESRTYDSAQNLKQKMTYSEGAPNGPAEFYKNGIPMMHTNFSNGNQHGEATLYDEAGMIRARIQYNQGKKHGTSISYDTQGRVQRVLHYHNGNLDGPHLSYYPSGAILESGNYVQGRKEGEFKTYYEDGALKKILVYDGGRLVRAPLLFDKEGAPMPAGIQG